MNVGGIWNWLRRKGRWVVDVSVPVRAEDEFDPQRMRDVFAGSYVFALMAIVLWAFSQPIMQMMAPQSTFGFGLAIFLVLLLLHLLYTVKPRSRRFAVLSIGMLTSVTAVMLFGVDVIKAFDDDAANVERCRIIQADMLSAKPRRTDGPALFEALNCRPEGAATVALPPPADERRGPEPPAGAPPAAAATDERGRSPGGKAE